MSSSKVAIIANQTWQKVLSILGWVIAVFSVLLIIMAFVEPPEDGVGSIIVFLLFTLGIGVFMIAKGRSLKKLIADFKQYVQILAGDPYNSIATIAAATMTSPDAVKKNVQKMIKKRLFANAAIDEYSNSIILNGRLDTQQVLSEKAQASMPTVVEYPRQALVAPTYNQSGTEMLTVKCRGCGAVNAVPRGGIVECEYCGNMVAGE